MSKILQPTPEAWHILRWLAEHGWSTSAQLLDRFFPSGSASTRAGYDTLDRMAEDHHLLQRHRLVPSEGLRSPYLYGLDTAGLRLLGIDARRRALVRGPDLDLALQLAEMRIYRAEEGWAFIPAHHLEVRWRVHDYAQQLAMQSDPDLASAVRDRARNREPKPWATWLPPLPTLWHPVRREVRTVLVLTSSNIRRLLPWGQSHNSALHWWRPVHFEVVTLAAYPARERALEAWLETYLGRLGRRRKIWTLHHAPDYRGRRSPSVRNGAVVG